MLLSQKTAFNTSFPENKARLMKDLNSAYLKIKLLASAYQQNGDHLEMLPPEEVTIKMQASIQDAKKYLAKAQGIISDAERKNMLTNVSAQARQLIVAHEAYLKQNQHIIMSPRH